MGLCCVDAEEEEEDDKDVESVARLLVRFLVSNLSWAAIAIAFLIISLGGMLGFEDFSEADMFLRFLLIFVFV